MDTKSETLYKIPSRVVMSVVRGNDKILIQVLV